MQNRSVERADYWQLRNTRLSFGQVPLLMGIINVTPDSFSDGGKYFDPQVAIEHGQRLAADGADILDIGGESTRPYSTPVSAEEEVRRILPVVIGLAKSVRVPISIDTTKSAIARRALDEGAEIINDISGLEWDPDMIDLARSAGAGLCAMHTRGTPQTMQDNPTYVDVVENIYCYLESCRDFLTQRGIAQDRICLDPGIGFGKTHEHNLTLLSNCFRFHDLRCPLLVGHSRKGFIGKVIGNKEADRTAGSIGVACALAAQGVQVLRVHDVRAVREALMLYLSVAGPR